MRKLLGGKLAVCLAVCAAEAQPVPRFWTDVETRGYRLPLAGLAEPPRLLSEADYYALPEVNLKTYPVYAPGKEPDGYLEWLRRQDPAPLVNAAALKTEADWIAAGREVFYGRELPRFTGSEHNLALIRDPRIVAAYGLQISKDGVLLGLRYVVREKGKVELGTDTCAMCHVRVLDDGSVIEGPANVRTPFGPLMGDLTRRYEKMGAAVLEERRRQHMREDYRVPHLAKDPNLAVADLPAEEIARYYDSHPPGVHGRTGASIVSPVKIANLIGLAGMKYFDRTGTARHRGIADLMRYASLVGDSTDALTQFGDGPGARLKPENMGLAAGVKRSPDASLYALAKFIYSLKPPPNPNRPSAASARGGKVFAKTGCPLCHPAPLYTSSKLTLVGTDPALATATRKGTGFYRVPSLRMVWLEACLLHDGSIGSLEEMFDPARLKPDFRSSNWRAGAPARAVPGHAFGLALAKEDRADLLAFLRTL